MFTITQKNTQSPILLTCEHASTYIPETYANLGLTEEDLKHAKDLFDPGALDTVHAMNQTINGTAVHPNFSRLVIDPNRRLNTKVEDNNTFHAPALKTTMLSERNGEEVMIDIPGNRVPDLKKEGEHRWNTYVKPYVEALQTLIDEILEASGVVYMFSIHSFYPVYNGDVRSIDIDVIHEHNPLAADIISQLQQTDFIIAENKPWSFADIDGGIKPLIEKGNVHIMVFDINGRCLQNQEGVQLLADTLTNAISHAIKKHSR